MTQNVSELGSTYIEGTDPTAVHSLDNLTKKEKHALEELKETNDLIITKAKPRTIETVNDKLTITVKFP